MCICTTESHTKKEFYFLKFSNDFLPVFLNILWKSITMYEIQTFKYICEGYKININMNVLYLNINYINKDAPNLIFLHLIKYSQRNINVSQDDYVFFPYIYCDFCFMYLCFFVVRCLKVYDFSIFFMNYIFNY